MLKKLVMISVLLVLMLVGVVKAQEAQPTVVPPGPTEDYSYVFYTPTPIPAESWNAMPALPNGPDLPALLNHDVAIYGGLIADFDAHASDRAPISGSAQQSTVEHPRSFSRVDDLLPLNTVLCVNGDNVSMAVDGIPAWKWGGIDSLRPDVKRMLETAASGVLESPELVTPDLSVVTGTYHNAICILNASTEVLTTVTSFPSSGAVKRYVSSWGHQFTADAVYHVFSKDVFDIINPGKNTEFFNQQQQFDVATNVPNCTLTLEQIAQVTGVTAAMDVATIRATMAQFRGLECPLVNLTFVRWDGTSLTTLYYGVYARYLQPSWVDLSFLLDEGYDFSQGLPVIPTVTPAP